MEQDSIEEMQEEKNKRKSKENLYTSELNKVIYQADEINKQKKGKESEINQDNSYPLEESIDLTKKKKTCKSRMTLKEHEQYPLIKPTT